VIGINCSNFSELPLLRQWGPISRWDRELTRFSQDVTKQCLET